MILQMGYFIGAQKREAEAVALKERSPFGLKTGYFRALQRPLLSQPDALASGVEIPNALILLAARLAG